LRKTTHFPISLPNDCGLRLRKVASGSDDVSSAMRPPQYQRVLLWAMASGPITKRSADTTKMCTAKIRIALRLAKRGFRSSCGARYPR